MKIMPTKEESPQQDYDTQSPTIIIRKKRKKSTSAYHAHAAWKVAYADFVTAMMAFFLLMWLISVSSETTLQGVAEYFAPTESANSDMGIGVDGGTDTSVDTKIGALIKASSSLVTGSPTKGHRIKPTATNSSINALEKQHFLNVMNSITQSAEMQPYTDHLEMNIADDGLHIEITDTNNRSMFKLNSAELESYMKKILNIVGKMIKDQPNYIAITGHTASTPEDIVNLKENIDFWDISAKRANEVRKYLTKSLINPHQVAKIVGKADTDPLDTKEPYSVKNIRIGITLLNDRSIAIHQKSAPNEMK